MIRYEERLPWELIEEILSRVPPKFLVRFRTVSKQWNALFNDKTFINNHKSTFRFILATESKIYTVNIDPKIVVRELTLDVPGLESQIPSDLVDCDDFLLCSMDGGAVVWNPWLNRTRWIKAKAKVTQLGLKVKGIGYDRNRRVLDENVYKTIWSHRNGLEEPSEWNIHDFASDTWKDVEREPGDRKTRPTAHSKSGVSLNGALFWVAYKDEDDPLYHIMKFDFSREGFFRFCDLPCGKNHQRSALVLRVFKGDRFSLLKQCHVTKKTEIWVTKNKINCEDGNDVVWMNLVAFSVLDLPSLVPLDNQPSYFIDDKRLVVVSCDETGRAWIYVVEGNKLIRKIKIDSVVDLWPLHCTYFPSLVQVP